jgi:hypothetical protein
MKAHKDRVHARVKTYKCDVDECPYSAVTPRELADHVHFNHTLKKTGSLGEKTIQAILDKAKIPYIFDQTLDTLTEYANRPLRFDFMVPVGDSYKFIEYDGKQHFVAVDYFGGEEKLKHIQECDAIKNKFCELNGYPLLRVTKKDMSTMTTRVLEFLA